MLTPLPDRPLDEWERVHAWRLTTLLGAGYPIALAEKLAIDSSVDLHKAVEMLERGCRPEHAAEILL